MGSCSQRRCFAGHGDAVALHMGISSLCKSWGVVVDREFVIDVELSSMGSSIVLAVDLQVMGTWPLRKS